MGSHCEALQSFGSFIEMNANARALEGPEEMGVFNRGTKRRATKKKDNQYKRENGQL